jgi:hypothetical protein
MMAMPARSDRWRLGRHLAPLLVAGSLLAACSVSPTAYQPVADGYGYSEQQIEQNRYRVGFVGNSATPRDTVGNYALFRAAELTVQSGFDYFRIVKEDTEAVPQRITGGPSFGVGLGHSSSSGIGLGVSTVLGGGGRPDYDYARYLDIVMFDGEKPADDPNAYSAWEIINRLKPAGVAAPAAG